MTVTARFRIDRVNDLVNYLPDTHQDLRILSNRIGRKTEPLGCDVQPDKIYYQHDGKSIRYGVIKDELVYGKGRTSGWCRSKDNLSIANMSKDTRFHLAKDDYSDVDLRCAGPRCLMEVFNQNKIECKELEEAVQNKTRERFLELVGQECCDHVGKPLDRHRYQLWSI